jgi:hypothetical protein
MCILLQLSGHAGVPCLKFEMVGIRRSWLRQQRSAAVSQRKICVAAQQAACSPLRKHKGAQPAACVLTDIFKHPAAPLLAGMQIACTGTRYLP